MQEVSAARGARSPLRPGRGPGAVVSRTVRVVVCRELGPLDNVVVEERATPGPRTGTGGRGRARRRRELRRRAHLPGSVPDEAGRPLRAGRGDRRCGECRRRRRHPGRGRGPGHGHDRLRCLRRAGRRGGVVARPRCPTRSGSARRPRSSRATARPGSPWPGAPPSAEGEWVLVLGAGGGIGLAAVDVALALGARVVAAASSEEKLDAARRMGAARHGRLRERGPEVPRPRAHRRGGGRGRRPGRGAPQ